ncbi:MAG: hypothetical protein V3T17_16765 [Pseudomonadales bacterium]
MLGGETSSKNRSTIILLLGTFLFALLVFADQRTFFYNLYGKRSLALSEIAFILIAVSMVFYSVVIKGRREFLRLGVWNGLCIALLLAFSGYSIFYWEGGAINAFLILGVTLLFLILVILLGFLDRHTFLRLLLWVGSGSVAFFLIISFLTNYLNVDFLLYGEGTPYLYWPQHSPSQLGVFFLAGMYVTVSASLAADKPVLLYLFVPAFVVLIMQTGSRAMGYLTLSAWTVFAIGVLVNRVLFRPKGGLAVTMLISVTMVSTLATWLTYSLASSRALEFVGTPVLNVASGSGDQWRNERWSNVEKTNNSTTVNVPAEETPTVTEQSAEPTNTSVATEIAPTSEDKVVNKLDERWSNVEKTNNSTTVNVPAEETPTVTEQSAEPTNTSVATEIAPTSEDKVVNKLDTASYHNVYLDILYGGGPIALLLFSLFLVTALLIRAWDVFKARGSDTFDEKFALLISILTLAACLYSHPLFHVRYIWILLAVLLVAQSPREKKEHDKSDALLI